MTSTDAGETAGRWLGLAASPVFAAMALFTSVYGAPDILCSAMSAPLGGMVPMYALMSAFHAAPWLKLAAGGRMNLRRSRQSH